MKQLLAFLFVLILVVGFSLQAHASLELLGQGTSTHGTYNLIYDTDLDITWYDYTNSRDTWQLHMDWATELSVNFGGTTYSDWRLPTAVDGFQVPGENAGWNITTSEMGHLFYTELGNEGGFDIDNNPTSCNLNNVSCLTITGDFQNLQPTYYWTGTTYATNPTQAWDFQFNRGDQFIYDKIGNYNFRSMAVMDGMAVVPEPISSILFLTGGALLTGRKYIRRKKIEV